MADGKKRGKKDSQLLIRIASEDRARFLALCERLDTTAAREIRRFIRDFVAEHEAQAGIGPGGGGKGSGKSRGKGGAKAD